MSSDVDLNGAMSFAESTTILYSSFPKPTWQYSLDPNFSVLYNVPNAPNAFHRWMQKLCFGIVWRKL